MEFKEDLKFGEVGEGIVLSKLLADHRTQGVFDVRKIPKYQKEDIDFIWGTWNDIISLEVKHQMAYKNLFYETESFGKTGCMERSKANFFVIYLPQMGGKILMVKNAYLKEYIKSHPQKEISLNDGVNWGKGYSIPIQELIAHGVAWYEWEED